MLRLWLLDTTRPDRVSLYFYMSTCPQVFDIATLFVKSYTLRL